jgi:hypothetical protein
MAELLDEGFIEREFLRLEEEERELLPAAFAGDGEAALRVIEKIVDEKIILVWTCTGACWAAIVVMPERALEREKPQNREANVGEC